MGLYFPLFQKLRDGTHVGTIVYTSFGMIIEYTKSVYEHHRQTVNLHRLQTCQDAIRRRWNIHLSQFKS